MLGSWDGFLVPMPFSKAYFVCSPPLYPGGMKDYSVRLKEIERGLNIVNEVAMALSMSKVRLQDAEAILEQRFSEKGCEEPSLFSGAEDQNRRQDT
jgi:hypothetical protein